MMLKNKQVEVGLLILPHLVNLFVQKSMKEQQTPTLERMTITKAPPFAIFLNLKLGLSIFEIN